MAHISVISSREPEPLDFKPFAHLAQFVLDYLEAPQNLELSIAFVGVKEMSELNEKFRKKNGPTDVLSFPIDSIDDFADESEPLVLGDVIISPEVAEKQAVENNVQFGFELNLLLVHGLLHLLGYDHIRDDEAQTMENLEAEILKAWELQA